MPDAHPVSLDPVVTGRLASTELNIIEAVRAGSPFRTTISLEAPLALAAVRVAAAEKREFSNFIEVALLDYSRQHGEPPAALTEFIAKATPVIAANPEILTRLEATLRKSVRTKRAAA